MILCMRFHRTALKMEQISSKLDEQAIEILFLCFFMLRERSIWTVPAADSLKRSQCLCFAIPLVVVPRESMLIHFIHSRMWFHSRKTEILSFRYCVNFGGIARALAIWRTDSWKSGFFFVCKGILWRLALNFRILDFYKF